MVLLKMVRDIQVAVREPFVFGKAISHVSSLVAGLNVNVNFEFSDYRRLLTVLMFS